MKTLLLVVVLSNIVFWAYAAASTKRTTLALHEGRALLVYPHERELKARFLRYSKDGHIVVEIVLDNREAVQYDHNRNNR